MTDPPQRKSSTKAPPTVAEVRATSRRLAARAATEDQPPPPTALPPWPDTLSAGPVRRVTLAAPVPDPGAVAEAADLRRDALARPALVSDGAEPPVAESEADTTPPDPVAVAIGSEMTGPGRPAAQQSSRGVVEQPRIVGTKDVVATPTFGALAAQVAETRPGPPGADLPGDDRFDGGHLAVTTPDLAAAVANSNAEPRTRPVSPLVASSPGLGTDHRPGPGPDEGEEPGEAPGVSGRLPALIAGLAMTSPAAVEGASPGGNASSPFGTGDDDFGPAASSSSFAGGGATADLSRTNELLQQILDALRRSSGPTLDGAGPAEFAGRL